MSKTDPIVQASKVNLVEDDYPTPKREVVAEFIDEHWNEQGGLTLSHIAEETGTSRQHVKNTLSDHFEIAESEPKEMPELPRDGEIESDTLELLFAAYRTGYQDGRRDEQRSGTALEKLIAGE